MSKSKDRSLLKESLQIIETKFVISKVKGNQG